MEFWYMSILEGYIMEFIVKDCVSFSKFERYFFKGSVEGILIMFIDGSICCWVINE